MSKWTFNKAPSGGGEDVRCVFLRETREPV